VLRLGRQIAGALAYLHASRVMHRDLKTGNILLDAQVGVDGLCDPWMQRWGMRG